MDSEHFQIAAEIIDQLIEACICGTSIQSNEMEKTSGNEFKCANQSAAGKGEYKEIVQEDEVSCLAADVEVFGQFDAVEGNIYQAVDSRADVRVMDEQCAADQCNNQSDVDHKEIVQANEIFGQCDTLKDNNCQAEEVRVMDAKSTECPHQCDVQSDAGRGDHKEIAQEDEVSYLAADVEVFETFDTVKKHNRQAGDSSAEVRSMDAQSTANGMHLNCQAVPANDLKNPVDAECELLKGFSTYNFKGLSVTDNLTLKASGNVVPKYEVRCENFPSEMLEKDLVLTFTKFGEVYKLTKNFESRWICVTFTNPRDAEKAINALNGSMVQGHRVKLYKQLPNRRLIVRNIPKTATRYELLRKFKSITSDLVSVSLYNDPENENFNRGFCYLEYPEHYLAAEAKTILSSKQLFRMPAFVEWPDRRFDWMETPGTLYIRNVRLNLATSEIKRIFSDFGQIVFLNRNGNFVSVQYKNVEDAKRAATEVDKSVLGNENVGISSVRLLEKHELCRYTEHVKPAVKEVTTSVWSKENDTCVKVMEKEEPIVDPNISDTLYINNLPSTVSTADLRKIFSLHGIVLDIDLDRNDGWASVHFPDQEQAKRTASTIDKRQLGSDVHISFFNHNIDKASNTLHISNLRSTIKTSDLRKCFTAYGEVLEIDVNNNSAMLLFRNAEDAKKAAGSVDIQCLGDRVQISYGGHTETNDKKRAESSESKVEKKLAEPSKKNVVQEKRVVVTSNTLYIYKMYANMTEQRLRQLFTVYGPVTAIELYEDYGAVRFRTESDAIRAAHDIDRIHLGPRSGSPDILFFPKDV